MFGLSILEEISWINNKNPRIWCKESNGIFSSKSLLSSLTPSSSFSFLYKELWSFLTPSKIKILCRSAAWNKILTQDNLKVHSFALANICNLCWNGEEFDHFIHCHFFPKSGLCSCLYFLSAGCFLPLSLISCCVGGLRPFPEKRSGPLEDGTTCHYLVCLD